jgi:hypothetical protein
MGVSFFISKLPIMPANKEKAKVIHLGHRVDSSVSSFNTISEAYLNTRLPSGGLFICG